jgi:hypothetical protein
MTPTEIIQHRLINQQIAETNLKSQMKLLMSS